MKQVVVHPERCVGCMQCQVACAVAHSEAKQLVPALFESPRPRPRIHVGAGRCNEGFPNRCRHCDPAPCLLACLPGAITRLGDTATVVAAVMSLDGSGAAAWQQALPNTTAIVGLRIYAQALTSDGASFDSSRAHELRVCP